MHASQVNEDHVLREQAYMLYYIREDKHVAHGGVPLSVPSKPSTGQANGGSQLPAVRHPTVNYEPGRAGPIARIGPTTAARPRVPLSDVTQGARRGVPLPAPRAPQTHPDGESPVGIAPARMPGPVTEPVQEVPKAMGFRPACSRAPGDWHGPCPTRCVTRPGCGEGASPLPR
jgi:hypothetical protein